MELSLRVINREGQASDREVTLSLTQGSLSIGRAVINDLCLDDPERVISGEHARIEVREGGVWVVDTSRNGTYLNNGPDPIPPHQSVALYDGDQLGIGPYDVIVGFGGAEVFQAEEIPDPFGETGRRDLGDLAPSGPSADILDLLDPGGSQDPGELLPDLPSEPNLRQEPFADASSLDAGLAGPAPDAPARGAPHRHTPVEHVFYRPDDQRAVPDNYDLLNDAWVGGEAPAPHAEQPPSSPEVPFESDAPLKPHAHPEVDEDKTDVIPELQIEPPEVAPAPPVPEPPRPEPCQAAAASGAELSAFLAGLGCGEPGDIDEPQAFMRLSGQLLRALAAGLVQTMIGRAQFKSELRLGVTSIRAAQNNPFKFSPNTDDLLDRMLFRPSPGYLPAVAAASEAFDDIQAHEMAMTAGLQAALRALFARFEPSRLEQRLGRASGLDQVLPMARKAKYWELFTEEYEKVAADASEDFMQLFEDAFARAYHDQIERLRAARR
ncbi:type VI secretion system-associated FHA domain protein TagH [Thiorhodococcus mannitoliphagus]|uniref:Type VI secretion system-associated FHA domain protein TagH n=1 Tax=Thiorhodococcus mannitoliphagus TaxID=329406 RepID=A0A6P1DZQ1_9GAMM|nr:type VI secretion system-associated FHA domain protein TagH [Thiorhodococcus mannitoliphagus]NEX22970.1 type VI secretion system-associated FHA domain protein TagH [Thiorhodococcus mannitoliphagus]